METTQQQLQQKLQQIIRANIEADFLGKMETISAAVQAAIEDLKSYTFSARTIENAKDIVCELDEEGDGHWLNDRVDKLMELIDTPA